VKPITILSLYRILGRLTPIPADCGELCNAKCCHGGEEDGMLILPGEDVILRISPGIRLRKTPEGVRYATCPGRCYRPLRPFFCRIYPLVPVLENGKIKVTEDPRAAYHCPLLSEPELMSKDFRKAVCRAGHILARDPEGKLFLQKLTEEINEYLRFVGK